MRNGQCHVSGEGMDEYFQNRYTAIRLDEKSLKNQCFPSFFVEITFFH